MIRKIDNKYILDTVKRDDKNGYVFVKFGVYEDRLENRTVKEPIPVIGKILPFLKRKVTKQVKTGEDLVVKEERVETIRRQGENAPKVLKDAINPIPFKRIVRLEPSFYGEGLYVGHLYDNKYSLLTEEGTIIGQFDMEGKGYYFPTKDGFLPKEASESLTENQLCEPLSLEDIVSSYMAKNPDSIKEIPESLYDKFPDLKESIKKEVSKTQNQDKGKNDLSMQLD